MKKYKIIILVLFVICVVSVWQNINTYTAQQRNRKLAINSIYFSLLDVSNALEKTINKWEADKSDANLPKMLSDATISFSVLDAVVKENNKIFQYFSYYFKLIAATMYYGEKGSIVLDGFSITPILSDGVISEDEFLYIKRLNDDIKIMIGEMVSKENPPQESSDITDQKLETIFKDFNDKWSTKIDDSPFKLIEAK